MGTTVPPPVIRFATFELDVRAGELHNAGARVKLQDKPFRLLAALLERPGELVTREELCGRLWPSDTFVDFDNSLNNAVNRVRAALGDAADHPQFVETVGRYGYRFIAPVETVPPAITPVPTSSSPERPPARVSRRTVVVSLALIASLLAAAAGWRNRRSGETDSAPIRSLAVLPFDNLSADREDDYLADGITDALITELAGIRSLRVISRQSIIRYKDSAKPLPEIAKELGVDGIVEGAVLRSGTRVRVSAQVVHGPRDEHLWARSFEGAAGDMLALPGEIARAVAEGVRVKLTPPEQARIGQAAGVDPEAYDLYLRGRYFFNAFITGVSNNRLGGDDTETVLLKCVSSLQRAVERDPRFALAHATLAFCYVPLANYGFLPPWEATPRVASHARKALELDPDLADGHLALAQSLFLQFDWAAAEPEYRKAIELKPGDAHTRLWYSYFLYRMGRFDESLAESGQGLRLDPFHPLLSLNHAAALVSLGRGEEALAQARHMEQMEPTTSATAGFLYLRLGREQEALAEFERAGSEEGIARIRALRGDPSGLRPMLDRLHERARQRYVSPVEFAVLLTALGQKDAAFARLEEAYKTKAPWLKDLKTAWEFVPLRSDPRWSDLLHRLKLD
jgi:TolB-like protein/DNA-binding winged helix-turn-helix (wHTH) protein/tetratricopeptide (TPR) repeat protein